MLHPDCCREIPEVLPYKLEGYSIDKVTVDSKRRICNAWSTRSEDGKSTVMHFWQRLSDGVQTLNVNESIPINLAFGIDSNISYHGANRVSARIVFYHDKLLVPLLPNYNPAIEVSHHIMKLMCHGQPNCFNMPLWICKINIPRRQIFLHKHLSTYLFCVFQS